MRLLGFLARYFGFLRGVPLLPNAFDLLLWTWTTLFSPDRRRAMEALWCEVEGWDAVTGHAHRFGGREWRVGGREIGHLHGNGVLDVRLTRNVARERIAAGAACEHHVFPGTGWTSLPISGMADLDKAEALLRRAFELRGKVGPGDRSPTDTE